MLSTEPISYYYTSSKPSSLMGKGIVEFAQKLAAKYCEPDQVVTGVLVSERYSTLVDSKTFHIRIGIGLESILEPESGFWFLSEDFDEENAVKDLWKILLGGWISPYNFVGYDISACTEVIELRIGVKISS